MPTFELDEVGPLHHTGVLRARDATDAVRRSPGVGEGVDVRLGEPSEPDGWRDVFLGGAPAGRVRPHQRMRFRRD